MKLPRWLKRERRPSPSEQQMCELLDTLRENSAAAGRIANDLDQARRGLHKGRMA